VRVRKVLFDVLILSVLSVVVGLGVNASLVKRYFKGEFRHGFVSQQEYPFISFITFLEAEDLFSGQVALFIDSRTAVAYREGHILGAVNVPYETPGSAPLPEELPFWKGRTLVIYCDGNECQSSIALAKHLHKHGCTDLRVFFGGWEEWLKKGLPIVKEDVQ
jgi:rhodanese-related sulfurtransferase